MPNALRTSPAGPGRVGMIGLGNMGAPMARRLVEAGHDLTVFDIDPAARDRLAARGTAVADSPEDLGNRTDTVLACLPHPEAAERAALGSKGLVLGRRFSTYVDLSTIGPANLERIARALEQAGVATIDCPISGGVVGAREGTLALMAAGEPARVERLRLLPGVLGTVFDVGTRPGQGQVMKLVNNLLSITAWTITAEGLAMGAKAGLDPAVMLDVLNAGSGRNIATLDRYGRYVLPRTFDSGFSMAGTYKDIGLCMAAAQEAGVPAPVGLAVMRQWESALEQGWGDRAHAHIASLYEERAGVELMPSRPPA